MLDSIFFAISKAESYYQDDHFNIWKFPAKVEADKRQKRPIILNYSIMTRAYGACFNEDSFIDYFNKYGFDVYLMDWGKEYPFTLSGWTLDKLADTLNFGVDLVCKQYGVENLNVFGVCIGGLITSYLINQHSKGDSQFANKFHKIAYYGSPILACRDLGVARVFSSFYKAMKPYRDILNYSGISMFALDMLLMRSISSARLEGTWQEFWEEGPETFSKMVTLTCDDRWVPFAAFMDLLEQAYASEEANPSLHFTCPIKNTHFFNLVGDRDSLVMPSASIVEWNSPIPYQFRSFEQVIFPGGHFIFAQPGFQDVKERLARWFAYYPGPEYPYTCTDVLTRGNPHSSLA